MSKKIRVAALLLLLCTCASGQIGSLRFENLSTIDGLSSSTCVEIYQDSEGFLWFGTIDGLNRYDGYDFTIYRSVINDPHSISSNRINAITEDRQGRLWIGTGKGLNAFDKRSAKFYRINYGTGAPGKAGSDLVHDLFFDAETNTLWTATQHGVYKVVLNEVDPAKPESLVFTHYVSKADDPHTLDNNEATSILKDHDRQIWIGTSGKYLNRYDAGNNRFERVPIGISNPDELDHIPRSILIDHDGDFWIGNNLSKLIVWNRKTNTFSTRTFLDKNVPIFHLYEDKEQRIWVASDGHGIYFIDKVKGITEHITHDPSNPSSISNNQPSKILEDNNGIIWIATYNTGVNKLSLSKSAFGHFFHEPGNSNSLSHKIAQSIIQDRAGRIWIGTDGGGLNMFEEKTGTFTHFKNIPGDATSLSADKIVYLCEGHDGTIWVCTWDSGLCGLNPVTKKFTRYMHHAQDPFSIRQNSIWSAVEDNQHRLWVGTQSTGLNLFDPATKRFYQYASNAQDSASLLNNFVVSLFIDSRNRLFAGTSGGLSMVDLSRLVTAFPEKLSFHNFREKSLLGNRINSITEDRQGNIWVGSDLGLNQLTADLKLQATYTTIDGLPNNLITGIREDDHGNIWITTKSGLSKFDPRTRKFKNFNTHDGLQGMEFQSKSIDKTSDGRILIGGINGFNIFDPEKVLGDSAHLKLLLTDFRISNRSVKAFDTVNRRVILRESISKTRAITLRYDEDYLSFDFLALNYNNPEKNRYACRMEGLDRDWNYVGNKRSISYSNLAPGGYTFEVMGSSDGTWDEANKISLAISILPPPWKTWWAYTLYTIALLIAVWVAMRYYTRRVREEKEHELDQMKLMFFINVSHEFRTPLTLILNPIDKILSASSNTEEVRSSALTIQRSARRLLNLVNQLLDFRKTDLGKAPLETVHGDILQFSKDIFLLFNDLAEIKGINFRFESNVESLPAWFDPDKVEKILTNLLSNAIKFTDFGGEVTLSVTKILRQQRRGISGIFSERREDDQVEFRIRDTGVGLKAEQRKQVFERFFHVDNSKTGTGIGLNFTKSLVALHHGEIAVESEYGKGSTFIVRLPLNEKRSRKEHTHESAFDLSHHNFDANAIKAVEYELAIASTAQEDDQGEAFHAGNGSDKKPVLLIVEDNRELRVHLKNELRNQFRIREAVNGADGLEKVLKHYPDIIISDIMMPEMDGFELCRKIKTEIETSHIPVVLLTARSLEEDRIEGYRTGADEYLPKPFNIHVLKARLKNLLESRQRLKEKFMTAGGVLPARDLTTNTLDEVFLDKVTKVILDNVSDPDFSLENLLEKVGISRSHFFRKISSLTGQNPSNFIRTVRLKYAAGLLVAQEHSIKEISYLAGFNSSAYFSKTFRELFGKTPQQYIEDLKP